MQAQLKEKCSVRYPC